MPWPGRGDAAGSGGAPGRHPEGQAGRDAFLVSEGPLAFLLSTISDAKYSTQQKTRNPCTVTSATSHCKLWTFLNAERKERPGGEGSKKHLQVPLGPMFTWWGRSHGLLITEPAWQQEASLQPKAKPGAGPGLFRDLG